jgi:thioredoxin reductase (NADPH)
VRWRHRDTHAQETHAIRNVFMFLGADPMTEWLGGCGVAVDDQGFIRTGNGHDGAATHGGNGKFSLEATVPGVFAIGDVRAGSVKRVGAAIGEGRRWLRRSTFLEASRRTHPGRRRWRSRKPRARDRTPGRRR